MKLFRMLLASLALAGLCTGTAMAQDAARGGKGSTSATRTLTNDAYDFIGVNSLLMHFSNNGSFCHNPATGGCGLEWPRGSGKFLSYTDGLLYAGMVKGSARSGGATYKYGWQAGPIDSTGKAGDPADPANRIYKIRRMTATEYTNLDAAERQRLRADFNEWPVAAGAPYIDGNRNGRYDPDFAAWLLDSSRCDKPFFLGDEFYCFFSNDLDSARSYNLYGSAPVGLEIRTIVWAYNRPGPLQNTVFVKHVVVNKGPDDFENAAFARWNDPDLGDANDDFDGIDTLRNLELVYNGLPTDAVYGIPPAFGIRMLQGPVAPAAGATAVYGFGKRNGLRNLPVGSYVHYIGADGVYRDPDLATPKGSSQLYNYLRSLLYSGNPIFDPTTRKAIDFCLPGDPVTGTGWVDGLVDGPADRRTMMGSKLFTMHPGDTQEVAFGYIAAQGGSVREGIKLLRSQSDLMQLFYDNLDLGDAMPDAACTVRYPQGNTASIFVRATLPHALSGTATFVKKDGTEIGWLTLFDDGQHGDGDAGDHVFANTWNTAQAPFGVDCFITAVWPGEWSYRWQAGACLPLAGPVRASIKAIESDHLNYDHIANPGENIRMSIGLANNASVPLGPWTVYNQGFGNGFPRSVPLNTVLAPTAAASTLYSAIDAKTYLTMDIPPGAADGELLRLPVLLQDTSNGCWCDTLPLTVHAFKTPVSDSEVVHAAGPANGTFGWRVAQPDSLLDHCYRITVRGGITEAHTLMVTDLTAGKVLLPYAPLPTAYAHEGATTQGWKLTLGSIVDNYWHRDYDNWAFEIPMLSIQYLPKEHLWYSENSPFGPAVDFFGSALKDTQLVSVKLVFDRKATQKAYLYLRGGTPTYGCTGYFDIPIRAYDISNPSAPRQLALAFVEQKGAERQDSTWDPKSAADREYLFVLNSEYTGQPDPVLMTKRINADAPDMPLLYAGWIYPKTPSSDFVDGDSLLFRVKVPITDKDTFYIHPSAPRVELPSLSAPVLLSPAHKATEVSLDETLRWTSVPGAERYWLQTATDWDFTSNVSNSFPFDTTAQMVNPNTGTRYYWRVAAINAANESPWSATRELLTVHVAPPPVLLSPPWKAVSVDTLPLFRWSSIRTSESYLLQVGDSLFRAPIDLEIVTRDTMYQATRRLRDGVSHWRVRGKILGNSTPWSQQWWFSSVAGVPFLSIPPDKSPIGGLDTYLAWSAAQGADSYRVQVAESMDFASPRDSSGVTGTSLHLEGLENNRTYWWRVSALNFAGQSGWSQVWSFLTPIVNDVSGISDASLFDFTISPQPARDRVGIALRGMHGEAVLVTLTDALGRRIAERRVEGVDAGAVQFETGALPPGMYAIKAVRGRETRTRLCVVVK